MGRLLLDKMSDLKKILGCHRNTASLGGHLSFFLNRVISNIYYRRQKNGIIVSLSVQNIHIIKILDLLKF